MSSLADNVFCQMCGNCAGSGVSGVKPVPYAQDEALCIRLNEYEKRLNSQAERIEGAHCSVGRLSDSVVAALKRVNVRLEKLENSAKGAASTPDPSFGTWIPCSERLPYETDLVLVCSPAGVVSVGRMTRGAWIAFLVGLDMGSGSHWMPLPEPPKGINA